MDFLKAQVENLKLDDHTSQKPVVKPASTHAEPKNEGLFDKISDAIKGETHAPPPPPPAPVKEENLFDKISNAIGGKKTPPPPPAPVKSDTLFGKIGDALGGRKTPPPPQKTDLLSKISSTITGKHEEPPKPQGLADKINHALGGGVAGEEKEGKLDKAIDLFQEHVLKEGPQHNESAVEQLKDTQIANTIRKTLGIEKKN